MNPSWNYFRLRYEALTQQSFNADSFMAWFETWSTLTKEVRELQARLRLAHQQNIRDAKTEQTYLAFIEHVMPEVEKYEYGLRLRLAEVKLEHYPNIELALRRLATDTKLHHPKNAKITLQIEGILTTFNKLRSSLKVNVGDRDIGLHEVFREQFQTERSVREEAFLASEHAKLSIASDIDARMLELLRLRQKMAEQVGLTDLREYKWLEFHRYEYSSEDSLELHQIIAEEVTPLLANHYEKKRIMLGVASLRPWDILVDSESRPALTPFANASRLEEALADIFEQLDGDLARQFAVLRDGYLDLEAREGKLPMVGYCVALPKSKRAFIYHSLFGTHADVWIMLHESGHAFHTMRAAQAQDIFWNQQPGLEFCELASQTLELLGLAYLEKDKGGFYTFAEALQAQEEQLIRCLRLIGTAQTDAFHHWLYPRVAEGVTIEELDQKWLELEKLYNPWLNWEGLEQYAKKGWQTPHVVMSPFYALEYKMAMFGAIDIWRKSLKNPEKAIEDYKYALSLGASCSLSDLFEAAGTSFSFEREHVRALAEFLAEQLATIQPSNQSQ